VYGKKLPTIVHPLSQHPNNPHRYGQSHPLGMLRLLAQKEKQG
jgi:hypothetical protein